MKIYNLKISLILIFLFTTTWAFAQSLPSTQQNSLRAPKNIKIDGAATEWNDQFQAYNKATELYYTIANDDDNLYLVVHAKKPRIIEKIIGVGVTFTINKEGITNYKNDKNMVVTFPLLTMANGRKILSTSGIKTMNNSSIEAALNTAGTVTSRVKQSDSLIIESNKLLTNYANTIKIKGVPGLPDTLSRYNVYKIKTAAFLDNNGTYTYELALPLKQLGISVKELTKLSYSIKLSNRLEEKKGILVSYKYNSNGDQIDINQDLDSTTDFWAEYKLAK